MTRGRRSFVIVGQTATASASFSLVDLAGTSGRLDVLLRCLRAALLWSHGVRRDTVVYLVLLGGPDAPRVLRIDGHVVRFVRPDERALSLLAQKALSRVADDAPKDVFVEQRAGVAVAVGGLEAVIADLGDATPYVLEEDAPDVRGAPLEGERLVFFLGDHRGFDEATRERVASLGARAVSLGPVSLHADDAVTVTCNELDRRDAARTRIAEHATSSPTGGSP